VTNPHRPGRAEIIDPVGFGRPAADTALRLYPNPTARDNDILAAERGQLVAMPSQGPDGPGMPFAPGPTQMYDGVRWQQVACGEPHATAVLYGAPFDNRFRYDLGVPMDPAQSVFTGRLEPWTTITVFGEQLFGVGLRPGGASVSPRTVYWVTASAFGSVAPGQPIPFVRVWKGGDPTSGGGVRCLDGGQSNRVFDNFRSTLAGLVIHDGSPQWPMPLYVQIWSTPGTVMSLAAVVFGVKYLGPLDA
jgi:hypothetical protein